MTTKYKNKPWPAATISHAEIIQEIKHSKFAKNRDILSFSGSVVDFGDSFFGLIDENTVINYMNASVFENYKINFDLSGNVGLMFTAIGSSQFEALNRPEFFSKSIIALTINFRKVSLVRLARSKPAGVSIVTKPEILIDQYKLNPDCLPIHVRAALLGHVAVPVILVLTLSPRCKATLDSIIRCRMDGVLKYRYVRAKTEELLCETVYQLNNMFSRELELCSLSAAERQRQQIEAAGHIYRQKIGQMPSVDAVAKLVGMNRNAITDGFKDIYGMTPGEYARFVRLDWARDQLKEGIYSVSEVSSMAGYHNTSSFSRAYAKHFDAKPSDTISISEVIPPYGGKTEK